MYLLKKHGLELTGWTGAAASLAAFSLNSLGIITGQSVQYLLLNVLGCFLLIIYAFAKKAHASWVLNSIWLLITVIALLRNFIFV